MSVNAWKYGREVYLVGRSYKFRYLTSEERVSVINFITEIIETRPSICAKININYLNAGKELAKQNSYSLLKMVQKIGKNFKVQFPTENEKTLCDTFIASVAPRAKMGYKDYVADVEEESSEEPVVESSNEESSEEAEVPNGSSEE